MRFNALSIHGHEPAHCCLRASNQHDVCSLIRLVQRNKIVHGLH
jgi:hypothetical protein